MTPKEYTQKLVDKIMFSTSLTHLDEVKEVAKIVVDEIIESLDKLFGTTKECTFYKGVKQEIEKL